MALIKDQDVELKHWEADGVLTAADIVHIGREMATLLMDGRVDTDAPVRTLNRVEFNAKGTRVTRLSVAQHAPVYNSINRPDETVGE